MRGLQDLVDNKTRESRKYGLDINITETKFMLISKYNIENINRNLKMNNQIIGRVKHTTYLGKIINEKWDISQKINTPIAKATAAFNKISKLFKSYEISP